MIKNLGIKPARSTNSFSHQSIIAQSLGKCRSAANRLLTTMCTFQISQILLNRRSSLFRKINAIFHFTEKVNFAHFKPHNKRHNFIIICKISNLTSVAISATSVSCQTIILCHAWVRMKHFRFNTVGRRAKGDNKISYFLFIP